MAAFVSLYYYAISIPYALYSFNIIILNLAACTIVYTDEKTRRTDFYLQFYPDDIISQLSDSIK